MWAKAETRPGGGFSAGQPQPVGQAQWRPREMSPGQQPGPSSFQGGEAFPQNKCLLCQEKLMVASSMFIPREIRTYKPWAVGEVLRVNVLDLLGLEMPGLLDSHSHTACRKRGK